MGRALNGEGMFVRRAGCGIAAFHQRDLVGVSREDDPASKRKETAPRCTRLEGLDNASVRRFRRDKLRGQIARGSWHPSNDGKVIEGCAQLQTRDELTMSV
jgi:hypothetical protein